MLNIKEAAEIVSMSPEDIMLSLYRGLPPGKLGHAVDGELFFEEDDLTPVQELTPKQQLQSQAETLGIEFEEKTTMAELEALIAEIDPEAGDGIGSDV